MSPNIIVPAAAIVVFLILWALFEWWFRRAFREMRGMRDAVEKALAQLENTYTDKGD